MCFYLHCSLTTEDILKDCPPTAAIMFISLPHCCEDNPFKPILYVYLLFRSLEATTWMGRGFLPMLAVTKGFGLPQSSRGIDLPWAMLYTDSMPLPHILGPPKREWIKYKDLCFPDSSSKPLYSTLSSCGETENGSTS